MGIDLWSFQFLVEARRRFGPFGEMLQIGRQDCNLNEHDRAQADVLLRNAGFDVTYVEAMRGSTWADEGLFQTFGATKVSAADASAYEGAEYVHDFNNPVPAAWHQRFDTVFDGGSLEHIFNIPVALANEMNMVRTGGHLLSAIPANNWLGHGFYQFSPELPYRVFTPENGFRMEFAFFTEMRPDHQFYEIEDLSRRAGGEIGTTNTNTNMDFAATKLEHVTPFRRWPQQGDYQRAWEAVPAPRAPEQAHRSEASPVRRWLRRLAG